MNRRTFRLALFAASSIVLAGCGAAQAAAPHAPSGSMSPGMSMAPGMSMPGMSPAGTATSPTHNDTASGPSASSRMICGAEIRRDVVTMLALHLAPSTTTTWAGHLYTCTYHLPAGPLVLSVKESPDVASATAYFNALRQRLAPTHPLAGLLSLGETAYDTPGGMVVVLKDDKILQINATGLPRVAGQHQQSRTNLAYEVASDIIGCWTGK
jgi:hypothetical protein